MPKNIYNFFGENDMTLHGSQFNQAVPQKSIKVIN